MNIMKSIWISALKYNVVYIQLIMLFPIFQSYHQRVLKAKKGMWNFTVLGVMMIDAEDYTEYMDKENAQVPQRPISTLRSEDLDIYCK